MDEAVIKWLSKGLYGKVNTAISHWPDYKKKAYDEMFASAHSGRIGTGGTTVVLPLVNPHGKTQ